MAPSLSLPAPWLVAVLLAVSVATLTSGQCDEGRFGPGCDHLCHCVNGSACDVSSGVCAEGCQEGYSGPWCQRRNVALGALAQGNWNERTQNTYERLVDGNNDTCDPFLIDRPSMLYIGLNSPTDVSNIVINMFIGRISRPGSFVTVSSGHDFCANHPLTQSQIFLLTGCDFKFKTDNLSLDFYGELNGLICEVSVFVCEPGFHGDVCDQVCGHCRNADCNQKTGTCAQGCEAGYTGSLCKQTCAQGTYGYNCTGTCGHCYGMKSCDPQNGKCPEGCEEGYTGSECKDACVPGRYGQECSRKCGHCGNRNACDPVSGSCPAGCNAGYSGERCQDECTSGTYGVNCTSVCGHCRQNVTCDYVTGSCPDGCDWGYTGDACRDECGPGTYGPQCNFTCGQCHNSAVCDFLSGLCPHGCKAGYVGDACLGKCTAGRYGFNCSSTCGSCKNKAVCDIMTGSCPDGCDAGFAGEGCQEKCSRDTYGENCSQTCPSCDLGATCHHVTGGCSEMSDRLGTGVGVGMAVCMGLVGVAVGMGCLLKKRGCLLKKKSTDSRDVTSSSMTSIPSQAGAMATGSHETESAYSSLELSSRHVDSLYQDVSTPYENMTVAVACTRNK